MDPDFKPAKRPAKSLQATLDTLPPASSDTKTKETFRTPAEIAVGEAFRASAEPLETGSQPKAASSASGWRHKLHLSWPPGNKEWAATLIIVLVGGFGIFLVLSHHGSKPLAVAAPIKVHPKAPPKPTTVPSTLSGLPVAPSVNNNPVTGVMIENSIDARPQSGLGQASVVFEAVAEGGVTRFLALYQDTAPDNVGPIRSARPYYVQWELGFNAGYAHVGGSPDALADIKAWGVRDLDEFANGGSYHRITSRVAPHNVYTPISTLNQLEAGKGYTTSTFTGFVRKPEAPTKTPPTAKTIDLTLSGPVYNAHYDYNAATNAYARSEGGAAQIDANTNQQIAPKVVVAMVVPETQGALDASGAYYSDYNVIGSGPVYVFQDGTVTIGQWTKSSNTAQITFTDASGKTLPLDPGQTWLTAVSKATNVAYAP
jgi:hypothetical protein